MGQSTSHSDSYPGISFLAKVMLSVIHTKSSARLVTVNDHFTNFKKGAQLLKGRMKLDQL